MQKKYTLSMLQKSNIDIQKPSIIFLYGDLWAGKTTLSQSIIEQYVQNIEVVTSPTYVYYNKYKGVYHFDLYRLRDYDEFISIWWEEILDNNDGIILIEWPELLEKYYSPDIKIYIEKTSIEDERLIDIQYKKS